MPFCRTVETNHSPSTDCRDYGTFPVGTSLWTGTGRVRRLLRDWIHSRWRLSAVPWRQKRTRSARHARPWVISPQSLLERGRVDFHVRPSVCGPAVFIPRRVSKSLQPHTWQPNRQQQEEGIPVRSTPQREAEFFSRLHVHGGFSATKAKNSELWRGSGSFPVVPRKVRRAGNSNKNYYPLTI